VGAPLHHPPLGCCPQCGFAGKPACFLHSFAYVLSSSPSSKASQEFSPEGPNSFAEAQGNVESPVLSLRNDVNFGRTQKPQQNRVMFEEELRI